MPHSNILVVVIDGLRASALGAYGNTTSPTAALDRFAAQSLVFDACYAPSTELADIYSALWQSSSPQWLYDGACGRAGAADIANLARNASKITSVLAIPLPDPPPKGEGEYEVPAVPFPDPAPKGEGDFDEANRQSMPIVFSRIGYHTTLVTDEPQLLEFPGAAEFDECVQLHGENRAAAPAADVTATSPARLFAAACEVIERSSGGRGPTADRPCSQPQLVWLHARGAFGPWDAPLELQQALLDADDPPPIVCDLPPNLHLAPGDDPDVAYRYGVAYAAQAMVWDACWQSLCDLLPPVDEAHGWLVVLLGARGYCLGEHGRIGGIDVRLPAEQLHVPWLIRFPDGRGQLARSSALVSHVDVLPTLLDWVNGGEAAAVAAEGTSVVPWAGSTPGGWRSVLLSLGSRGRYSFRSVGWTLRGTLGTAAEEASAEGELPPELFVRPDDRWEANDVAKLCPEVVEQMERAVIASMQQRRLGRTPRS